MKRKRFLAFILSVVLMCANYNMEIKASNEEQYYSIKVIDNNSNEEVEVEIVQDMFNKSNKKMRLVDENELEVEYDVIIKFEVGENQESEITPRQSITTEKEEASVRTRLKCKWFMGKNV